MTGRMMLAAAVAVLAWGMVLAPVLAVLAVMAVVMLAPAVLWVRAELRERRRKNGVDK